MTGPVPCLSGGNNPPASHPRMLENLARICSDFAWGRLPAESAAILAGARLIPIGTKGGGVRRIAVGEVIRRSAGRVLSSAIRVI